MFGFWKYNWHIWESAAKNGASRGSGMLIGFLLNGILLAMQISLGLYSSSSTRARWISFVGVQIGGLILLSVGYIWHAAWVSHKRVAGAIIASRNAAQARRLFEQLGYVKDGLRQLGPNVCFPLQKTEATMDKWLIPVDVFKDRFQQRYKMARTLAVRAGLEVKKDNAMKDDITLLEFPCSASYDEINKNIEEYSEGLRIYAANAEAEVVKATNS